LNITGRVEWCAHSVQPSVCHTNTLTTLQTDKQLCSTNRTADVTSYKESVR